MHRIDCSVKAQKYQR